MRTHIRLAPKLAHRQRAVLMFCVFFPIGAIYSIEKQPEPSDEIKLFFFVQNGNIAETKKILQSGINPNARDPSEDDRGETPLMKAAVNGDISMTKLLLEHGADINATDERGETALLTATHLGYTDLSIYLVNRGANLKLASKKGYTPLLVAADQGHFNLLKYFISKGGSVFDKTSDGFTSVMAAAKYFPEIMEFLIQQGVDPNAKTTYGGTALMAAAKTGNPKSVEILLKHGVQVGVKTHKDNHAIKYVVESGRTWRDYVEEKSEEIKQNEKIAIWNLLLNACLNETGCIESHSEIIFWMIQMLKDHGVFPETAQLKTLLSHKNRVQKKNAMGFTPLDIALYFQYRPRFVELIKELRSHGAEQTIPNSFVELSQRIDAKESPPSKKEIETIDWRSYLAYRNSALNYGRILSHSTLNLHKLLASHKIWNEHIYLDQDILEIYCRNNDTRPFEMLLKGRNDVYSKFDTSFHVLADNCGTDFTVQTLEAYHQNLNPTEQKIFQEVIYKKLRFYPMLGSSGQREMILFLSKSGFKSVSPYLLHAAIATHRKVLLDEISLIENIQVVLDDRNNNAYHYLFAQAGKRKSDVPIVEISTPVKSHFSRSKAVYDLYEWIKTKNQQIDAPNLDGITPLMLAVRNGLHAMTQDLLRLGADPLKVDRFGFSAIHYALLCRHTALLNYFPKQAVRETQMKIDALLESQSNKNLDLLKLPIVREYFTRMGRASRLPPLPPVPEVKPSLYQLNHCVMVDDVENDRIDKVKAWLQKGYSPNCRKSGDRWVDATVLSTAVRKQNLKMIELLLRDGHARIDPFSRWVWEGMSEEKKKQIETLLEHYDEQHREP